VDSNANVFVAGQTSSADLPISANAFDKALSGGFGTGFVAMVSTVGGVVDAGADTVGDAGAGDAGAKDTAVGDATGIDAVTVGSSEAGAAVDAGSVGGDAPAPSDAVSKNPGGSKQGCGCRIASTEPPAATLWLLAVGFLLLARRRR
jgi:MYXO-CTERM domain-containing protein